MRVSRRGFLSPAVKRLLGEQGLDASDVVGTGAGGRITRRDVERAVVERREALTAATLAAESPPPDSATQGDDAGDDTTMPPIEPAPGEPLGDTTMPPIEPALDEPVCDTTMPPIEPMQVAAEAPEPEVVEGKAPLDEESAPEPPLVVDWDEKPAVDEVIDEAAAPLPQRGPAIDGERETDEAPDEARREARDEARDEAPAPPPRREPATVAPSPEPESSSSPAVQAEARETLVPFTPMRRRIAENLKASRATAAHAFCAVEADFEEVDRVRHANRDQWREDEGFALTYLPFVARAVTTALAEFPHLNASVVDDALLVHEDVHLGIAVDLEFEGLIVPVIRDAATKTIREIAREVSQLAEKARGGRLRPDDIASGTFTITNPGPSGTLLSVPIINQPQVAILATDSVRRRPVMVPTGDGGEGIAIHAVGLLGLSFDHRAVDGLYAASFVNRVKQLVETNDWDAELAAGPEPSGARPA